MALVQANGIEIEYEVDGEGEPLLAIMGLAAQLVDWPPQLIEALVDAGFQVIRFDNRDSGLSTEFTSTPPTRGQLVRAIVGRRRLATEYLLDDMAADAAGLLDALGLASAHVMGVSMGGMIAQSLAINHPDRVRSLTSIMSTTGDRRVGRPTVSLMRKSMRRPNPTREDAVEASIETFRAVSGPAFDADEFRRMAQVSVDRSFRPAGTARQTAAIIASPDRTPGLRQIDVPTLVIHGMIDPLVQPSGGTATAAAVHGSRLLMFNDMAHDLPKARLSEIAEEIARNAVRARQVVG
jgi:pimeloyl-ACP methyl ester carboxylesterase